MHFAFWVSVLQSIFMQLLSACGESERVRVKVKVRVRVRVRFWVRGRVRVRAT